MHFALSRLTINQIVLPATVLATVMTEDAS